MAKPTDLRNQIHYGDYNVLVEIFKRVYHEDVSVSYVGKVIRGERNVSTDTSEKIITLARQYIKSKKIVKQKVIEYMT